MVYEVTGKRYLLRIGRAGEQNATEVVANIQPWLELWPNGTAAVLIQRPNDDYFYTALNVVQDNESGTVTWSPDATDTAQDTTKKSLKVQFVYTNGNSAVIARAPIWSCRIESSLIDDTVDPPDVMAQWFNRILDAADRVYAAAAQAEAWTEAFEWILESMDTDYPAVQTFLSTVQELSNNLESAVQGLSGRIDTSVQEINERLDGSITYDARNEMLIFNTTEGV